MFWSRLKVSHHEPSLSKALAYVRKLQKQHGFTYHYVAQINLPQYLFAFGDFVEFCFEEILPGIFVRDHDLRAISMNPRKIIVLGPNQRRLDNPLEHIRVARRAAAFLCDLPAAVDAL
jgi:hypothetical protein